VRGVHDHVTDRQPHSTRVAAASTLPLDEVKLKGVPRDWQLLAVKAT
jgi:hypothetical protein